MRNRRVRKIRALLEALEARQLLSSVVQTSPMEDSSSTQIQAILQLQPTYQVWQSNNLSPFQTAGAQGYTPSEIRTAYGMTQVTFGSQAGDGSGQTIAIIDAYNDPTIQADLVGFDAAFGLANPTLKVVAQDGSNNLPSVDPVGPGGDNFEGEEALDVEWAHAMAPGATIMLVEANDATPTNLFAAVNYARQQPGVSVISMSWGGNEFGSETSYDSYFTTPSGHTGVTFIASTGDSSAPAGYPAYSPNVVAAGGTSLSTDSLGNYLSETGWSGSGGGISQVESQPTYQTGIVTQSSSFRTAPDIAFDADPSTGVSVYDSYNNGTTTPWEVIGGTSVAAPAWAGIIAVADQGRVLDSEGTLDSRSNTLPLLYSAPAADFHDITSGNNGYSAQAGYDLVTGRGSPVANLLVPYLVNGTIITPPPTGPTITNITANATTIAEGAALTLTANGVSDPGATGITTTFYEETNGVAGLQTDPTTGDFSFTPVTSSPYSITLDTTNATGTYTFYAQVTDSSGGATATGASAPSITVTVVAPGGTGPNIASVSASPNPVVTGDTLTLTANGVTDPSVSVRRVYFYEETNGIAGLQIGYGGDFSFRPVTSSSGYSIQLDTTGVTGSITFYAVAQDYFGNTSPVGTLAPSVTVNISTNIPPDAPTGLVATAVSSTEIDLSFTETDSGQSGFTIERAADPSFATFTKLFTINRADALAYQDTGLTPNTTYYYRVQAFNTAGDSGFSNIAQAFTIADVYGHGHFDGSANDELIRWDAATGTWYVTTAANNQMVWGMWSTAVNWSNIQFADINGDGKTDVIGQDSAGQWWAAISTGSSFTNDYLGTWSTAVTWVDVHAADVNGDGKADVIGRTTTGQWWAGISTGSSFVNEYFGTWSGAVTWSNVMVADVNGDGKADVIGLDSAGEWWAGISNGSSFSNVYLGAWSTAMTWSNVQVADINGDGKADVIGMDSAGAWWAAISNGSSFTNIYLGAWSTAVTWSNVMVADINGDGKADVIGRTDNGQWYAGISTGTTFTTQYMGSWSAAVTWVNVQVLDLNGDGKYDVLGEINGTTSWWAGISSGSAFTNQNWL